jgi:hypothetical protein
MTTTTSAEPGARRGRRPFTADERLLQQHRVGPVDRLPADGILALLPQLPDWPAAARHRTMRLRGAATILDWLLAHPGEGWQDRWTVSGAGRDTGWIEELAPGDTRQAVTRRQEHIAGLGCLLMCRVVLPSYDFLAAYRAKGLLDRVREIMWPEQFARLENAAAERGLSGRDRAGALRVISKIVLHTGAGADALTADDVLEMFAWSVHADPPRRQIPGLHAAWDQITHLALVSYRLPDSGEVVPLLQIVPSKGNEERLLLVDPELASVLATIITRLRAGSDGAVPLVARYDHHERTTGPLLPHLFQRARGARSEVISTGTVCKLISTALAAAGSDEPAGEVVAAQPAAALDEQAGAGFEGMDAAGARAQRGAESAGVQGGHCCPSGPETERPAMSGNAGMPRWTAWSWRCRVASIWASLSSVPARLTLRPSISPSQPSRPASAMRSCRLTRISSRRSEPGR